MSGFKWLLIVVTFIKNISDFALSGDKVSHGVMNV